MYLKTTVLQCCGTLTTSIDLHGYTVVKRAELIWEQYLHIVHFKICLLILPLVIYYKWYRLMQFTKILFVHFNLLLCKVFYFFIIIIFLIIVQLAVHSYQDCWIVEICFSPKLSGYAPDFLTCAKERCHIKTRAPAHTWTWSSLGSS